MAILSKGNYRMMENDELLKGITKRILEGLTPKEVKVLDLLRLSNKEIGKKLDCKPDSISQVLYILYDKFSAVIDFKGSNKRATLIVEWQRIREQYRIKLVGEQDS